MYSNLFWLCCFSFVIEINTLKLYLIKTNDDTTLKLSDIFKKGLHYESPRDDLRSEFESFKRNHDKNICNRHFGSIFGTRAQKLLCLENYYEDHNLSKGKRYKRNKKQRKETAIRKPFLDLTSGLAIKTFSSDYLDVKDFARSMDADEFSKDYLDVGDLARDDDMSDPRRSLPYETKLNKNPKDAKFKADSSDSDSESSDEECDEKPKRFQVVDNKSGSEDSGCDLESSEEKPQRQLKKQPKRQLKKEPQYIYSQGRNRHIENIDGRKRIQHFLPKRFHWEDKEIRNLGYYWYDGTKGNYGEAREVYK